MNENQLVVSFFSTRSYDVRVVTVVDKDDWENAVDEYGNDPRRLYDALYEMNYEFDEEDISLEEEVITDMEVM